MILSIHQPQYLPWVPYLDKADRSDVFVYLDNVQYQKNGLQNRNQIKTDRGPLWLTVPVHASLQRTIAQTEIAGERWKAKHIRTIECQYGRAQAYELFAAGLRPILQGGWKFLADLNIAVCEWMFGCLGVRSRRLRASSLNVTGEREQLILSICEALRADIYLSGQGARGYQNENSFHARGIKVLYQDYENQPYPQCGDGFTPELSALDLILNQGKAARAVMLAGRR